MKQVKVIISGAVYVLCFSITPALAHDECKDFAVTYVIDEVTSVDHLREGRSSGDNYAVKGTISDLGGTEIGSIFVSSTVMPYDETIEENERIPFLATMHYVLPDGSLSTSGIFERIDTGSNKNTTPVTHQYPVTGGTGVFAHASGQMVGRTDEKSGKRWLNFEIKCSN